jgi:putative polyhydroxyalkanoate system protein
MADINIYQDHQLDAPAARAAAQKVADEIASEFDMAVAWEGDVLSFTRSGISGTLTLLERAAQLEITLGFMLKGFAATIEEQVGKNMAKVFAKPMTA